MACAGLTLLEQGQPEYDRRMVEACAQADSANALLGPGEQRATVTGLAKSRKLQQPTRTEIKTM